MKAPLDNDEARTVTDPEEKQESALRSVTRVLLFSVVYAVVTFLLIFVIFYFLLIRPQAKRQREHSAMVSGLKKGDEVLTQGGIWGVVVGTRDDVVVLKIAEETKVEVAKHAISALRGKSTNG